MYNFRIENLIINDGTIIEPKKINIIVGANNSGKSRLLKDIRDFFNNDLSSKKIVVKEISYELPTSVDEFIEKYNLSDRIISTFNNSNFLLNYSGYNHSLYFNDFSVNYNQVNDQISLGSDWKEDIANEIKALNNPLPSNFNVPIGAVNVQNENRGIISYDLDGIHHEINVGGSSAPYDMNINISNFTNRFGKLFYQYLGTEEKLLLCKRQKKYGIDSNSLNFLSEVQFHIDDMKKLSNITHELFGKYLYLDRVSFSDSIAIRTSDTFNFYEEFKLDDANSERILRDSSLLDDEGDGIKNFVVTYLSLKSMSKDLILLDEPESFLHPPLAKRLGEIIVRESKDNQQIFIATHSEDLIKGIILSSYATKINLIHIKRESNNNFVKILGYNELLSLRKTPILLMSNILKGLFSEKVYITESFSDSALYSLLMSKYNEYSYFYFVNTESKDKIGDVIRFYDLLDISNISIFDFDYFRKLDILKKTLGRKIRTNSNEYSHIYSVSKEVNDYLSSKALNCSKIENKNFDELKEDEQNKLLKKYKDIFYHEQGINSIDDADLKSALIRIIEDLKNYHIYVLKDGTLESTLKNININFSHNKSAWIDNVLSNIDNITNKDIEMLLIKDLIGDRF